MTAIPVTVGGQTVGVVGWFPGGQHHWRYWPVGGGRWSPAYCDRAKASAACVIAWQVLGGGAA